MIRRIHGIAVDVHPTYVVIDVQGVGYLVYTTARSAFGEGSEVTLFTHLAVRENALDLYGFTSMHELAFFEQLLTLPKIGPKSAIQILSQADVSLIQNAIISQDPAHLSKMSGISRKTAEKIVLGLKDLFDAQHYTYDGSSPDSSPEYNALLSDTIDALVTLGYPQADARKTVQQLLSDKPQIDSVNDAIKEALKVLA